MEKKFSGKNKYIPSQQDVVFLNFNPEHAKEKWHRRPGVVLNNAGYSEVSGMVLICPIRSKNEIEFVDKTFFIPVKIGSIFGYVDPLHFYTLDFQDRNIEYIGNLDSLDFQLIRRVILEILE